MKLRTVMHRPLRVCLPEPELTDEERATVVGLEQKLLESETEEDENALQQRIEDIEGAARARQFTPAYKAAHGVVVSFEYGDFCIQRGVKRVEPAQDNGAADGELPATDATTDRVITIKSPGIPADAFSEKLVRAMSSERTLAVQAALSGRPHVALALLTWTLCRNVFGRIGGRVQAPLGVSIRDCTWSLTSDAPSGKQGAGWRVMQDMRGALLLTLPPQWETDFRTMLSLSTEQLHTLLSYCVASGITGVQERRTDAPATAVWRPLNPRWTSTCATGGSRMRTTLAASARSRSATRWQRPGTRTAPARR